jgi:flagellar hook-basal body complex protein FliE
MFDRIGSISGIGGLAGAGGALLSSPPVRGTQAPGNDFADYLARAASEAAETVRAAEQTAIRGIEGKADIQQVVDQVMAAERTLSAALAIRNKLVAAWMEISRMQI